MGRVYILGAGASAFGGYPISSGLWSFVRDCQAKGPAAVQQSDFAQLESLITELAGSQGPSAGQGPDIEALFTHLDLRETTKMNKFEGPTNWSWLKLRFIQATVSAFLFHEWKRQTAGAFQTCKLWQERISEKDSIITFNWDILHEVLLYAVGKWHPYNGYGFQPTNISEPRNSLIEILKLHGSVNWLIIKSSLEVKLFSPSWYFPVCGEVSQSGPVPGDRPDDEGLIIPSYFKDVAANPILVRLWAKAAQLLSSADEIVAIGYSLNPADQAARQLIATSILNSRTNPSLTIVSPRTGNWDSLCSATGITPAWIQSTFQEWVGSSSG